MCVNRSNPKQYKVSSGTRAPTVHLKERHSIEEETNRKVQRLGVLKDNIAQAFETAEWVQKLKAVGLDGPYVGLPGGRSTVHWNKDTHKALLVGLFIPERE
jgi:hypothetical protein